MKIDNSDRIFLSSVKEQSKLSIQANSKMFEILSSKIYSDNISAIIRELSCNAWDSHKEANNPEPFKIYLPNQLSPYFEIEDFGIGMTQEQVETVYTQYGNSTKTGTNDLIGAFGLGSKTPFSYASQFVVRSRKDGVEVVYNMCVNGDGEPCYSLISKSETTESNGVSIKIPVKNEDFYAFNTKTRTISSFFLPRPEVVGSEYTFEYAISQEIIEGLYEAGYCIFKNPSQYTSIMQVLMGNVAYTVPSNIADKMYNELIRTLCNNKTLIIKFDIGDLEISASRETLQISENDKSYEKLLAKVSEICDRIVDDIQKKIDAVNHPFEMFSILVDCGLIDRHEYEGLILSKLTYNGMSCLAYIKKHKYPTMKAAYISDFANKMTSIYKLIDNPVSIYQFVTAGKAGNINIFYSEKKKPRVKMLIRNHSAFCINYVVGKPMTDHMRNRLHSYFFFPINFINIDAAKKVASPKKKIVDDTKIFAKGWSSKSGASWTCVHKIDPTNFKHILYVESDCYSRSTYELCVGCDTKRVVDVSLIKNLFDYYNIKDALIICKTKTNLKNFPEIKSLESFINELIINNTQQTNDLAFLTVTAHDQYSQRGITPILRILNLDPIKSSQIRKAFGISDFETLNSDYICREIPRYHHILKQWLDADTIKSHEDTLALFQAEYPILNAFDMRYGLTNGVWKLAKDYIKMVDFCKGNGYNNN